MRMTTALVGLVFLSFTACVKSALNPDDPVTVTGKALNEDGTPVANADLILARSDNSACAGFPGNFATIHTGADGSYSYKTVGKETQNGDTARCFRLSLPPQADGSTASHDFLMQVTDVKIPELKRWQAGVTPTARDGGVDVTFKSIAETHGFTQAKQSFDLSNDTAGSVYWSSASVTSPIALDDYMLEDFSDAKAQVHASNEVRQSGTDFEGFFGSSRVVVTGHGLVPASRGASCTYANNQACKLTDGKPDLQLAPQGTTEARIALPSAKVLKKAVFRGFSVATGFKAVIIEGSPDGASFTQLATISDAEKVGSNYFEVDLTGSTPVSVVRVKAIDQADKPLELSGFRELSLFE